MTNVVGGGWTDRREGGNSGLDKKCLEISTISVSYFGADYLAFF